jgi:hypothetical protein
VLHVAAGAGGAHTPDIQTSFRVYPVVVLGHGLFSGSGHARRRPSARQVTIIAAKGRVRLTGQVNTAEERAAIERSARKAANVIDVKNQLVVLQ